jgi:outer membrane protein
VARCSKLGEVHGLVVVLLSNELFMCEEGFPMGNHVVDSTFRLARLAWSLTAIVLFTSGAARADDTVGTSDVLYALGPPADASATPRDTWRFTLGAGVVNMPTFPGSSSHKNEVVPTVGASRGSFFVGANPDAGALLSLGGYLVRNEQWRVGAALTYDVIEPREESDDAHLQGLGDIARTSHAEVFAIYSRDWASLRGSLTSDIGGNSRGAVATLDFTGRFQPAPRWTLTAGPGLSWATDQYSRAYFGVDSQQSLASGLPTHRPGSGLYSLRFSAAGAFRPNVHWTLGGAATAAWLQGDAADSPVAQKRNQMTYTVFANYLF